MQSTNLKGKIERKVARMLGGRRLTLPRDRTVVSFTFDDVPRSACETGARILEAAGACGTYYVCGGLEDTASGTFFDTATLQRLHQGGHEIGSHGFAHLDYQSIPMMEVRADLARNDEYFAAAKLPTARTFAYPFGCLNSAVKQLCASRFDSSRGVESANNSRTVDLALVKAIRLYAQSISESSLSTEFEQAKRNGGWLVFMTHGVLDSPGEHDATPRLIETAVKLARACGFPMLTMAAALGELRPKL
ncbi:MAG: polysaccharide deacetylase family protein [Sphingomicrobium sp.]